MKIVIHKCVSQEKLRRMLPEPFLGLLPQNFPEPVTAVIFQEKVVTGRMAHKGLEKVGPNFGSTLLFLGRRFTQEASEAVVAARGLPLYMGGSLSSDERLFRFRAWMATSKKGPEDVGLV